MAGKLFVIDGVDGSGKHTQAMELYTHFLCEGYVADEDIAIVSFPRYKHPSAKFVEMYLNGDFSKDAMDIDPYTTSLFYAIDRSISFKTEKWGEVYRNGGIVIADRYYTSNIIHQGAKILSMKDKDSCEINFKNFIYWLTNLELECIKIPNPDKIFWLITDEAANTSMMQTRIESDSNHITDIHESNNEYLNWCRTALQSYKNMYIESLHTYLSSKFDPYSTICYNEDEISAYSKLVRREEFIDIRNSDGNLRSITDINNELISYINKVLYC